MSIGPSLSRVPLPTGASEMSSMSTEWRELDFDPVAFLQTCSEYLPDHLLPPARLLTATCRPERIYLPPHPFAVKKEPQKDSAPPGKTGPKSSLTNVSISPHPVSRKMPSRTRYNGYTASVGSMPSSSSVSLRGTSQSQSQSPPPPTAHSYSTPSVFSSFPTSFSMSSYFSQQGSLASSLEASPPWQTTDTEAEGTGFEAEYTLRHETDLDDSAADLSARSMTSKKSKPGATSQKQPDKEAIPRPPNAWILYRSDMLRDLAAGNDIPNLDKVLAKMGHTISSSASSDESGIEGSHARSKARATTIGSASGSMPPPSTIKKAPHKGGKAPTEEFLSLGRGKAGKGLPQADISKVISNLWKSESAQRRAFYEEKASLRKLEHQKNYPDYKFQPMRKAEKIKLREEKEKERAEAKRQKNLQRLAAKADSKRPPRHKHVSPASPYSLLGNTRRPNLGSVGRSLSYSGGLSTQSHWGGGYGSHTDLMLDPALAQEPSSEEAVSVYPFPMPYGALPSIPQDTPSAMIAEQYHAMHYRGPMPPQPPRHQLPDDTMPFGSSSGHLSPEFQPQDGTNLSPWSHDFTGTTEPPSLPGSSGLSASAPVVPTYLQSGSFAYQPEVQKAIPFIAESLPMDYQGRPMAILGLDDIEPLPEGESDDPNQLAEMWWNNLQEDDNQTGLVEGLSPNGLFADDRTLQMFEFDADQMVATGARAFGSVSSAVAGSGAADPLVNGSFELPTDRDDPLGQGYIPMYVSIVPQEGEVGSSSSSFGPALDSSLPYLSMETLDSSGDGGLGIPYDDQGPFLSTQQPLSPTDSWSAGPTPREATFLRAAQDSQNRVVSTDGTVRSASTVQPAPRYVSSSSYPLTPLSIESGSLLGSSAIGDRTTSFSALASAISNQDAMVPDDMLGWDDHDVFEHEDTGAVPVNAPTRSLSTHVSRVSTPVSVSHPSPEKTEGSGGVVAPSAPSRKMQTRGRAVAANYDAAK
ncbi:hypothetical protein IAU60_003069 [Kwoniella sp. DSM 27419]